MKSTYKACNHLLLFFNNILSRVEVLKLVDAFLYLESMLGWLILIKKYLFTDNGE